MCCMHKGDVCLQSILNLFFTHTDGFPLLSGTAIVCFLSLLTLFFLKCPWNFKKCLDFLDSANVAAQIFLYFLHRVQYVWYSTIVGNPYYKWNFVFLQLFSFLAAPPGCYHDWTPIHHQLCIPLLLACWTPLWFSSQYFLWKYNWYHLFWKNLSQCICFLIWIFNEYEASLRTVFVVQSEWTKYNQKYNQNYH